MAAAAVDSRFPLRRLAFRVRFLLLHTMILTLSL